MNDDAILVEHIYRAAAGRCAWRDPLQAIVDAFGLWIVQLFGIDTTRGTILFSHEGGSATPETAFEWFHRYHRIDPRAALVARSAVGHWIACEEHFDEDYVAESPFYQEFLIPHGGRYVFGAKLSERDGQALVLAFHRGRGTTPLSPRERERLQSLAWHVDRAFQVQRELRTEAQPGAIGLRVLERMRQPLLILDSNRAITFANDAARHLVERGDLLRERDGYLVCADRETDTELMFALRQMFNATPVDADPQRATIKLLRPQTGCAVVATLISLRPEETLAAFGPDRLALLAIYDPASMTRPDPFMLARTFDFTPAQARVAAMLADAQGIKQIARALGIAESTVRTHVNALFAKTHTSKLTELVRVLTLSSEF